MTNSFLNDYATASKNLWNLCTFTHTLHETKQRRFSNRSSPLFYRVMNPQTRNLDISFHPLQSVCRHSPHPSQKRPPVSLRSPSTLPCSFPNLLRRSCPLPHLLFNQSQVPPQGATSLRLPVRALIPGGLILPSMTKARILSIRFRTTSTETDTRTDWIASPKGCKL